MGDSNPQVNFLLLNVQNLTRRSYLAFINNFRRQVGFSLTQYRPVLPTEGQLEPPILNRRRLQCTVQQFNYRRYFDIIIRIDNYEDVYVRMQRFDLYVRAFRQQSSPQWRELARNAHQAGIHDADPLLFGGTRLGFNHTYDSLRRQAGGSFETIHLGRESLINAVAMLATSADPTQIAKSLVVVIQMICEAARFIPVSEHVASTLHQDLTVPGWTVDIEHDWATLSNIVARAEANPGYSFTPVEVNIRGQMVRVETVEQAREILGVLKRDPETIIIRADNRAGPSRRHRHEEL